MSSSNCNWISIRPTMSSIARRFRNSKFMSFVSLNDLFVFSLPVMYFQYYLYFYFNHVLQSLLFQCYVVPPLEITFPFHLSINQSMIHYLIFNNTNNLFNFNHSYILQLLKIKIFIFKYDAYFIYPRTHIFITTIFIITTIYLI